DQRLSPHAGSATFWGWLHPSGWVKALAVALPHAPSLSNNSITALTKALAFTHGLLCDARKLTHIAYLRRDPLVPELLNIERVPSQSSFSRFLRALGRRRRTCVVLARYGSGVYIACPAARRATRWIWIPRACCMRTGSRRAWRSVTPSGA